MAAEWLPWALLSVALWGTGTLTAKPSTDRAGATRMFFWAALVEAATFLLIGLTLPRLPWSWDVGAVAVALFAALTGIVGYLFFYEGLAVGTVSVVGTVTAAYPALTVVLGVTILGETITGVQAFGVVLLLLVVVLVAYEPRKDGRIISRAAAFAILGFVLWGLWGGAVKVSIGTIGEANLFLWYAVVNAIVGTTYFAWRGRKGDPAALDRRTNSLIAYTLFSGAVSAFAVNYAYTSGPASLVTPVAGSYPVIATLAAAIVLKERMTPRIVLGLFAFVAGIVLVAWA